MEKTRIVCFLSGCQADQELLQEFTWCKCGPTWSLLRLTKSLQTQSMDFWQNSTIIEISITTEDAQSLKKEVNRILQG